MTNEQRVDEGICEIFRQSAGFFGQLVPSGQAVHDGLHKQRKMDCRPRAPMLGARPIHSLQRKHRSHGR